MKTVHNFETAKSAGIIFQCTEDKDFETIKAFKTYLENRGIETLVAGYVDEKLVPDHFLLRQGFHFFCKNDLNWIYIPNVPVAMEFLKKDFDLLFDLSKRDLFPVQYLVSLCKAQYKVGRFSDGGGNDLMIDVSKEKGLDYFTEQIIHYLNILHRSHEELIEDSI